MECGNSGVTSSRHGASEHGWAPCFPETCDDLELQAERAEKAQEAAKLKMEQVPSTGWRLVKIWTLKNPADRIYIVSKKISMLRHIIPLFQLLQKKIKHVLGSSSAPKNPIAACVAGDASLQTGWERSSLQHSEADPWKRLGIDSFQYSCCEASRN